MKILGVDTA